VIAAAGVYRRAVTTPAQIDEVFRRERGRVLATVIRIVDGDFELAEELVQDAFVAAVEGWQAGVPDEPRAWLIGVARNKAIDVIRRRIRYRSRTHQLAEDLRVSPLFAPSPEDLTVADDRLRLIFTCCHPAIAREAQVALTLRTLCGLATDEIARAFLVPPATMAQRLVRAQHKIAAARIPYEVPAAADLAERTDAVLAVIYLVFNEGYAASRGDALVRRELCGEAIRLGELLVELTRGPERRGGGSAGARTPSAEALGLLGLMLLQDARKDARVDDAGELVLLEDQDRSRWDGAAIGRGAALAELALAGGGGPYALQAAIAAVHGRAATAALTDWSLIATLYAALRAHWPTPVVALNHAVAVAMAEGPARGLVWIDALGDTLADYYLFHAARADLLRRLGRAAEAAAAYRAALARVGTDIERRFLARRLAEQDAAVSG
jgi:RNA polymerase sigma-70 factor (ECF subfamily)